MDTRELLNACMYHCSETVTFGKGVEKMSTDELRKAELKAQLLAILPAVFVRQQVRELTGGMIDGRTLANRDSDGTGPGGKVKMGKTKVGYLREPFVDWFVGRLEIQG